MQDQNKWNKWANAKQLNKAYSTIADKYKLVNLLATGYCSLMKTLSYYKAESKQKKKYINIDTL